jgi:hypothetical protein
MSGHHGYVLSQTKVQHPNKFLKVWPDSVADRARLLMGLEQHCGEHLLSDFCREHQAETKHPALRDAGAAGISMQNLS